MKTTGTAKETTYKILREKHEVKQDVKDKLKDFNRIKKGILDELKDGERTVIELANRLKMPKHEIVFYLMSLLKYGFVQKGDIDDMDEYFTYKLKS